MIISDLEYLEVVGEENRVEGGDASVAGAVASGSAYGTNQASILLNSNAYTFFDAFSRFLGSYASASATATAS